MLPSDIRLFTWIDVEAVIQSKLEKQECPDSIVWIRSYWDGLFIGIRPDTQKSVLDWLSEIYEPRFDFQNQDIILESLPQMRRLLNVIFEETIEKSPVQKFKPSLQRPPLMCNSVIKEPLPEMNSNMPPVMAFHSFKGGVGRTLSALAMVKAITNHNKDIRVLFIDADLEAPGVTWMVQKRFPNLQVSFADFLALVHGDSEPDGSNSVALVAERVREMLIDQTYILPAFRTVNQFHTLEIKPEHLIQGSQNPFILTETVAKLGSLLGVGLVIVDLRAGLSELATGFLLDPRVFRVIVTTLSSQSIEGSCREIELLGKLAPSLNKNEPVPALVFSQVPEEFQKNGLIAKYEEQLLESAKSFFEPEDLGDYIAMPRIITSFSSNMQVLSNDWNDLMKQVSILTNEFKPLVEWLPLMPTSEKRAGEETKSVAERRKLLADFSNKLIYAETGTLNQFLSIPPLRNLASDFSTKIPVSVVIGAKGAGKTFTFLQVVFRSSWSKFIEDVGVQGSLNPALICPILKSKNIASETNSRVLTTRAKVAQQLKLNSPPDLSEISDYINDQLKKELHEGNWREIWLDIIAWSAGFKNFETGAGRRLSKYLNELQVLLLPIIDGLEDLFQELSSNDKQKTAIRALIQDVPEWLEQQPNRNIGLLVFVRQDMVLTAIKQNSAQLIARYEPYALKWNVEEALRLAAWICVQSEVLREEKDLQKLNKDDLTDMLIELWGRKLGSENSREARSAEWVIAALSDLRGQIQARDLVRFLHEASIKSESDTYWDDRILIPTAIKAALQVCSNEKIREISIENNDLKEIFNNLRNLKEEYRQIPFIRDQTGLSIEQVQMLQNNGVAYLEKEEIYLPEIYRAGLNFKLKAGARPRVLALSRKVRK